MPPDRSITFREPAIDPDAFYAARSRYYHERGWDAAGCLAPEPTLLERLHLSG